MTKGSLLREKLKEGSHGANDAGQSGAAKPFGFFEQESVEGVERDVLNIFHAMFLKEQPKPLECFVIKVQGGRLKSFVCYGKQVVFPNDLVCDGAEVLATGTERLKQAWFSDDSGTMPGARQAIEEVAFGEGEAGFLESVFKKTNHMGFEMTKTDDSKCPCLFLKAALFAVQKPADMIAGDEFEICDAGAGEEPRKTEVVYQDETERQCAIVSVFEETHIIFPVGKQKRSVVGQNGFGVFEESFERSLVAGVIAVYGQPGVKNIVGRVGGKKAAIFGELEKRPQAVNGVHQGVLADVPCIPIENQEVVNMLRPNTFKGNSLILEPSKESAHIPDSSDLTGVSL